MSDSGFAKRMAKKYEKDLNSARRRLKAAREAKNPDEKHIQKLRDSVLEYESTVNDWWKEVARYKAMGK